MTTYPIVLFNREWDTETIDWRKDLFRIHFETGYRLPFDNDVKIETDNNILHIGVVWDPFFLREVKVNGNTVEAHDAVYKVVNSGEDYLRVAIRYNNLQLGDTITITGQDGTTYTGVLGQRGTIVVDAPDQPTEPEHVLYKGDNKINKLYLGDVEVKKLYYNTGQITEGGAKIIMQLI